MNKMQSYRPFPSAVDFALVLAVIFALAAVAIVWRSSLIRFGQVSQVNKVDKVDKVWSGGLFRERIDLIKPYLPDQTLLTLPTW